MKIGDGRGDPQVARLVAENQVQPPGELRLAPTCSAPWTVSMSSKQPTATRNHGGDSSDRQTLLKRGKSCQINAHCILFRERAAQLRVAMLGLTGTKLDDFPG
jgi:hypothetical protein